MESWKTDHLCPRCSSPLFGGRTPEVEVTGCGRCGGIWLDTSGTKRVMESFDRGALELAELAAQHAGGHVASAAAVITCPVCRGAMKRSAAAGGAVIIDTCPLHGTWFDKGELQAASRAIRAPGRRAQALVGAGAVGAVGAVALSSPDTTSTVAQVAEGALDLAGDVALNVGADLVAQGAVNAVEMGIDLAASAGTEIAAAAGSAAVEVGASAVGAALEAGASMIVSVAGSALEAAPEFILEVILGAITGIFD